MAEPLQQFSLKSIPIIDPSGQFGTIDKSEAAEALKNGFRLPSPEELKEFQLKQEYGTGFGNELKALLESAASAATFGGSRILEEKLFDVPPEAQAARAKYSPLASGVLGPVLGIGGSLLLPELAGPAALAGRVGEGAQAVARAAGITEGVGASKLASSLINPVKAVSEGSKAVKAALLPAAQDAASLVADPQARAVAHKVLSHGLAGLAGSAVEGVAYGLGQSVDEAALGDPDLNAEKVLANIGWNAALSGGIGGIVEGAIAPFLKNAPIAAAARMEAAGAAELPVEQFAREAATDTFETAIQASMLPDAEKSKLLEGLRKLKPNVKEIDAAAEELGVPAFPGQRSADEYVQNRWGMVKQSSSPLAVPEAQRVASAAEKVSTQVEAVVGGQEGQLSKADFGEKLRNGMFQKIEVETAEIGKRFDSSEGIKRIIEVPENSVNRIANNVLKLDRFVSSKGQVFESSVEYQFAKQMAEEIRKIGSLRDIDRVRETVRANSLGEKKLRYIAGVIHEKLSQLEDRVEQKFIAEKLKTGVAREKVAAELAEHRAAKRAYAVKMRQLSELAEIAGNNRIYGPKDMLKFIDEIQAEKLGDKVQRMVWDKASGNAAGLKFLKEEFPAQFEALKNQIKAEIRSNSIKNKVLDVKAALHEIERLSPEARQLFFSPQELKTLKAADVWHEAFPPKWGPSGTPQGIQYMDFAKNPISAISMTARDAVSLKFAYAMAGSGENAAKIAGLASLERAAQATTRALQRGSREIFSDRSLHALIGAASVTRRESDKKKKSEQVKKEIKEAAASPELLMEKLDKATAKLFPIAPKHSGGVQMGIIRGTQFLHSKLPQEPALKPLSPKHVPNQTEVSRFNRYYDIVENPIRALEQVKAGTITHETIETLTTVYPKLYAEMKTTMLDHLTDHVSKSGKPLPYKVKLGLSLFLGTDLDHSMSPQAIMANQQALAAPSQQRDNQPIRVSQKGLSAITKSERLMTPFGGSDSETS